MGVLTMITENSCNNVLVTTVHSWVNMSIGILAGVFQLQDGLLYILSL